MESEAVRELPARLDEAQIERYLHVLGVGRLEPSLEALSELVRAQLTRVPFENISKLYYYKALGLCGPPPIELYLDGIENNHFGGTCYANNFHFGALLDSLGYEVKLCGADMTTPDVHVVIMAAVDGREYLVDGGYGAPFLEPMPRDAREDYVITLGRDRYVLKPQDRCGYSRLEFYRQGALHHGYVAKPTPRSPAFFEAVIARSFRPDALFLNAVLLARFTGEGATVIHNLTVTESVGSECSTRELAGVEELCGKIEKQFGIPATLAGEAVADLGDLRDPWS
jgi:N-hydroxyarylamine O-acetyltransferase